MSGFYFREPERERLPAPAPFPEFRSRGGYPEPFTFRRARTYHQITGTFWRCTEPSRSGFKNSFETTSRSAKDGAVGAKAPERRENGALWAPIRAWSDSKMGRSPFLKPALGIEKREKTARGSLGFKNLLGAFEGPRSSALCLVCFERCKNPNPLLGRFRPEVT